VVALCTKLRRIDAVRNPSKVFNIFYESIDIENGETSGFLIKHSSRQPGWYPTLEVLNRHYGHLTQKLDRQRMHRTDWSQRLSTIEQPDNFRGSLVPSDAMLIGTDVADQMVAIKKLSLAAEADIKRRRSERTELLSGILKHRRGN
jgi:hypothetical protein